MANSRFLFFRKREQILENHRNRDRADAAGNGGEDGGDFCTGGVSVARYPPAGGSAFASWRIARARVD